MIQKRQFFQTMTAAEYRQMTGISHVKKSLPTENKYHAKKTEVDGIMFDSKKEAHDWRQLCLLQESGAISNLQRQVQFELQPKFTNNKGEHIRAINYVADFVYEKDGKKYVQDSKSPATRTPVYKIKKKLFEAKFRDYIFLES